MKKIKNLTLGILGATILSLGLYACSNEDATTSATTEKTTMAAKENREIKELALDEDFITFVRLNLVEENLNYDINLVNKLIEDNQVTEEELELVPTALGYGNMTEYKESLGEKISYLKKVDSKFKLDRFTQFELSDAIAIAIGDIDNTTLNDCKRERNNCYNVALSIAIVAHLGCGGLDLTIIGGLACHGAVTLGHVAMNDQCEVVYNRCVK